MWADLHEQDVEVGHEHSLPVALVHKRDDVVLVSQVPTASSAAWLGAFQRSGQELSLEL